MKSKKSQPEPNNIKNALKFDASQFLKGETPNFVCGILLLFISVFMILAFISYISTAADDQSFLESANMNSTQEVYNHAGKLGAIIAHFFMNKCFGFPAFFIPLFCIFVSMRLMRTYKVNLWRRFLNYAFLMIWSSIAITYFFPDSQLSNLAFRPGGMHGYFTCNYMSSMVGQLGLFFIIVITGIFYLIYLSRRTIIILRRIIHPDISKVKVKPKKPKWFSIFKNITSDEDKLNTSEETNDNQMETSTDDEVPFEEPVQEPLPIKKPVKKTPKQVSIKESEDFSIATGEDEDEAEGTTLTTDYDPKLDLEFYKYPTLDLLKKYDNQQPAIDIDEQNANKERITMVLHNFGVEISSIKATVGPTITLYEITPAQGVRIAKIKNLEDDIALSLSAMGIRIIAPIPGKGTIGIEVPNKNPRIVSIESILNSKKFQETDYELPIAIGKTITNEVYMVDLAKMPHLLVAGATGQGKSVGLNAIITSLLYKKHPSELKMVLVDPKKVEFSIYAPILNHFLAKVPDEDSDPIITDTSKVVRTLKSLCQEMDDRYMLLKQAGCRNIKEYNAKFKSRRLNPENGHRYLPYFVIIIDEFGDLIMTAGKEVELPIARIAQLARAVGMHMVIATQRPTTNIITGTIKANFPARMAFKVTSVIDSRTILDQGGANQLVGKGDLLMIAGGALPTRVQCAFIDTPEVERVNTFIAEQQGYLTPYELPEVAVDETSVSGGGNDATLDKLDSLFEEAARLIVIHQQGSTSLIQRKFAIGYNRAGRIMDQLEKAGIVGIAQGSKPRDVLCSDEADLQQKLENLSL